MVIVRFRSVLGAAAAFIMLGVPTVRADVVTDWNNVWLDAIRAAGGGPGPIARDGAMLHVAIFDAVNSIDHVWQPMHTAANAPSTASQTAAAAQAAHDVLAGLFPTAQYPALNTAFDTALSNSLASVPAGQSRTDGINLGSAVAANTLAWRAADGSGDPVPYNVAPGPGIWQPTAPDFTPAWGPGWGLVSPMCMNSGFQFRPPLPPALTSQAYSDAVNEVKSLGALNSVTRTAEQSDIARFWANDRNGSEKPPGQLNAITQTISAARGNSVDDNARLFALLNVAMMEGSIAAWDEKFVSNLWRPVDAIRNAALVPNSPVVPDPMWEPLSNAVNGWTPPFPAYISGHATFAGAWAEILKDFYGTDDIAFDAASDDLAGTRHYTSLSSAAIEDGRSRIYLGVHFQFDADYGIATGQSVADFVFATSMAAVPEPTTLTLLAAAGLGLLGRRRRSR